MGVCVCARARVCVCAVCRLTADRLEFHVPPVIYYLLPTCKLTSHNSNVGYSDTGIQMAMYVRIVHYCEPTGSCKGKPFASADD